MQGVLLVMNGLAILNNERFLEKCEQALNLGCLSCHCWLSTCGNRIILLLSFLCLQMAGASLRWVTTLWDPRPTHSSTKS